MKKENASEVKEMWIDMVKTDGRMERRIIKIKVSARLFYDSNKWCAISSPVDRVCIEGEWSVMMSTISHDGTMDIVRN